MYTIPVEHIKCICCNQTFLADMLENDLCPDCRVSCEGCGEVINKTEAFEYDDKLYCEDCENELFACCDRCGCAVSKDEMTYVESDEEYICDYCLDHYYVRCDCCDNLISVNDAIATSLDNSICPSCYENDYFSCASCGEVYHLDDYYGEGFCQNCYENEDDDSGIHDYSYKPTPIFHYSKCENKTGSTLFFGIELEVENNKGDINFEVDNLPEFVYPKYDGSLANGFEIVSHPTSWNWLKTNASAWNQILKMRNRGFRSYETSTCGIHIHLSKAAFSNLHLYKFLNLFYANPNFITVISRRSLSKLNQWASLTSDNEAIVIKAKNKGTEVYNRYVAVNLLNHATIEIRIFKGTLAENSFWQNIEFCKAAYEYTKQAGINDISVIGFCTYVAANKKEYPNLYFFLQKKNYLPTENKKNVHDHI